MHRAALIASASLWVAAAALAQQPAKPAFEVASIRPAERPTGPVNMGLKIDGAQVHATLALKDFIAIAHRVKAYQVSGPDWLASEWFDFAATVPAGSPPGQVPEMMQRLLADRFQMKLHREKRDFPVYALELGKGPLKLQESAPDDGSAGNEAPGSVDVGVSGSGQGVAIKLGHGASYTLANDRFEAKKLTIPEAANLLERFLDRPIVDMTGLTGRYDFVLEVSQEDYRAMLIRAAVSAGIVLPPQALRLLENGEPVSLFNAVEKLGLKLEAKKAPLDLLVIDAARKTPTDN
jgi:uncharacterized protein (TIGR03435 family)